METTITQADREAAIAELVRLKGLAAGIDGNGQDCAARLAVLNYQIDTGSAWRAVHYGEKVIRALMRRKVA